VKVKGKQNKTLPGHESKRGELLGSWKGKGKSRRGEGGKKD
jgi:hypothetical protein